VAALVAASLAAPDAAWGAAVMDNFRQGSHAGTASLSIGFTVGSGSDRLLLVGVSTARSDVTVTGVSWRGMSGTRVAALPVNQGTRDCRSELWRIIDPPSGMGQVAVSLSSPSAIGMGMVAYSGVDQQSPTGNLVTASGSASPVRVVIPAAGSRPILGMACLGGTWGMMSGPDAVAASNDVNLWDFTEQNVVGLGNHQVASGSTAISWNVSFSNPFAWGIMGVSITPVGGAPPPDAAPPPPDVAPPPPDVAPPPPDVSVPADAAVPRDVESPGGDLGVKLDPQPDAGEEPDPSDLPDALEIPDDVAPPPDTTGTGDPDSGTTVRDVDLQVGCACRLGGGGRSSAWMLVWLAAQALALRRR
jgi:hypothetical protein